MRSVLSISISPKKLAALKKKVKAEGITVSAYFIRMIDEDMEHVISEEELLEDLKQGEKDLAEGRYRTMGPNDNIEDFLPIKK